MTIYNADKNKKNYQRVPDYTSGYDCIHRRPPQNAAVVSPEFLLHEYPLYEIHHDDFAGTNGISEDSEAEFGDVLNDYWLTNVAHVQKSPTTRRPMNISCIGLTGETEDGGMYISSKHVQYRSENLVKWLSRNNFHNILGSDGESRVVWYSGLIGLHAAEHYAQDNEVDIVPADALAIREGEKGTPLIGFFVFSSDKEPTSIMVVTRNFVDCHITDTKIRIDLDTWYRFRIERTAGGDFLFYIQHQSDAEELVATVLSTSKSIPIEVTDEKSPYVPYLGEVHIVRAAQSSRQVFIDYDTIKLYRSTDNPQPLILK